MLVATLVAVMIAGCGGEASSGDEDYVPRASTTMTVASPPISRLAFVKRVNRICRQAWTTVRENFADYTSWQDPAWNDRRRFEDAVRSSLLAGIDFHIFDNIRILGAPPGEEKPIEAMIGPFQAAVELGQMGRWRAHSVTEIPPRFSEYNHRARRYGLDDCLVDMAHMKGIALADL